MSSSRIVTIAGFCLALGLATAQAQSQADAAGFPQRNPQMDRLHNDLVVTPQQEDGWRAFQQAYAIDPQDMDQQRQAAASMPRMTAPQRVDTGLRLARRELAAEERRGDALKAFYASLTPQQQRIFDRETLPSQQDQ